MTDKALAKNTTWAFLGYGIRQLLRGVYFLIIPRFLGAEQYGAFLGVTSLIAILAPFATLGIGNILVKNVARDREVFAEYWGNSLFLSLVSGVVLIAVGAFAARALLPASISWTLILLVAVSDLLFIRVLDNACLAFQAFDMLGRNATLNVTASVVRLLAAVALVLMFRHSDALLWGVFYLISSVIVCAISIVWVQRSLGSPRLALRRLRPEMAEGFYFSLSLSAQTIYNDIDKTMVASLSTLSAAGIYGAAYRIIDTAFLPVRSLLGATYASFFRHGAKGVQASTQYAKKLLPRPMAYSVAATALLYFGAPLVPHFLGAEYRPAVDAIRWLSALPILKTIHSFIADSLTGAGLQGTRTAVQVVVGIVNVALNFWLIPLYSWRGAAWASLATDALLAVGLWLVLTAKCRQHSVASSATTASELA